MELLIRPNKGGQKKLLLSTEAYVALIAGRGMGKTWVGARKAILMALQTKGNILLAGPKYEHVNDVMLPELERALTEYGIKYSINKNEKNVKFLGRIIYYKTLSKKISGLNCTGLWFDEICQAPIEMVQYALGCIRGVGSGYQRIFTGTSEQTQTSEWLEELFTSEKNKDQFLLIQASCEENTHINVEEHIQALGATYSEAQLDAYVYGKWMKLKGMGIYSAFNEAVHVKDKWIYRMNSGSIDIMELNQHEPLLIACDFGRKVVAWSICQMGQYGGTAYLRVLDEIHLETASTQDACRELARRFPSHRSPVHFYGDRSGWTGSSVDGQSEIDMIRKELGRRYSLSINIDKKNPFQGYRFNVVNAAMRPNPTHQVAISPKCKYLIRDLVRVKYDDSGAIRQSKEDDTLTHHADGFGYLLVKVFNPLKSSSVSRAVPL